MNSKDDRPGARIVRLAKAEVALNRYINRQQDARMSEFKEAMISHQLERGRQVDAMLKKLKLKNVGFALLMGCVLVVGTLLAWRAWTILLDTRYVTRDEFESSEHAR